MGKDIKKIVAYYTRLNNTNNPFIIANNLGVQIYTCPLGKLSGYYKYLKHHRCIYINSDIEDENYKTMVMAHELGHAVLNVKENSYFMNHKTLLLTSKIEREANTFTAELMLDDNLIREYSSYTIEQISCLTGIDINLVILKMEGINL